MRVSRQLLTKQEFGDRAVKEEWLDILKMIAPEKLRDVKNCKKLMRSYTCGNGHQAWAAWNCNERNICPVCAQSNRLQKTEKVGDDLGRVKRRFGRLDYMVVNPTIPKKLWSKIANDDVNVLGSLAWKVMKKNLEKRHGKHKVFASIVSVHYWHSKDPLKGWYPHVHMLVLCMAYNKLTDNFEYFSPYMDYIESFRKDWTSAVTKKYGNGSRHKLFNVWTHYHQNLKSIRHEVSYLVRRPIFDLYKYIKNGGEFTEKDVPWTKRMLIERRRNIKNYFWNGWMSDSKRTMYLNKIEVKVLSLDEFRQKHSSRNCLICGLKMIADEGIESYARLEDLPEDAVIMGWSTTIGGLRY